MARGLVVTPEMQRLIDRPGFLKVAQGGQRLRELYSKGSMDFTPEELSPFGIICFMGRLADLKKAITSGTAPDLLHTETPYKLGYLTIVVSGKLRMPNGGGWPDADHRGTIRYLIEHGCPTESEDIVGQTALQHACVPYPLPDLARVLLALGANPDHQNKYGSVALLGCCMQNHIEQIGILMEHGASLDIPEADGFTVNNFYGKCGPYVVAEVQKWLNKRSGEEAPLQEKRCDSCGKSGKDSRIKLSLCSRCRLRSYCSSGCQKADWKTHKLNCRPFSAGDTTVTVKPHYLPASVFKNTIDPAERARKMLDLTTGVPGYPQFQSGPKAPDMSEVELDLNPRRFIVKVQVPARNDTSMLVYNRKRDFRCQLMPGDDAKVYDRIRQAVREKGVMGIKAYFQAELKNRDELLIQTGEALAAQPF